MAIGHRLLRVEDRPLLVGQGSFLDDLSATDALEAAFVRSPTAHGVIRGIDREEAMAMEGVFGVFTAEDLGLGPIVTPSTNPAVTPPDQPVLASGKVRYAGEPVAVVLAESRYLAEDAADKIWIDIEPLETITSIDRALDPSAPEIHPGSSNVVVDFDRDEGDFDAAMEKADVVVERIFETPRNSAMPIEPRAVLAVPDGDGIHLHTSSQAPHKTRHILAEMIGIDYESIRVSVPDIGGGFGVKAHTYPEEIVLPAL